MKKNRVIARITAMLIIFAMIHSSLGLQIAASDLAENIPASEIAIQVGAAPEIEAVIFENEAAIEGTTDGATEEAAYEEAGDYDTDEYATDEYTTDDVDDEYDTDEVADCDCDEDDCDCGDMASPVAPIVPNDSQVSLVSSPFTNWVQNLVAGQEAVVIENPDLNVYHLRIGEDVVSATSLIVPSGVTLHIGGERGGAGDAIVIEFMSGGIIVESGAALRTVGDRAVRLSGSGAVAILVKGGGDASGQFQFAGFAQSIVNEADLASRIVTNTEELTDALNNNTVDSINVVGTIQMSGVVQISEGRAVSISGDAIRFAGAGFVVNGGTLTLDGVDIQGSAGVNVGRGGMNYINNNGRGITVANNGTLIMNDGSTINGFTYSEGAGVQIQSGSTFVMNGGEIFDNFARGQNGGGGVRILGAGTSGSFEMHGGIIRDNAAITTPYMPDDEASGGGVSLFNDAHFTMQGGEIRNNTTIRDDIGRGGGGGQGGGVHMTMDSTLTITGGSIHNNRATAGGGIQAAAGSMVTMSLGDIHSNHATVVGGGVNLTTGATLTMYSGEIRNNTAHNGGGVRPMVNATFTMYGGAIHGNRAEGAGASGGGVHIAGSHNWNNPNAVFNMRGGEIFNNSAQAAGGGVWVQAWTSMFNFENGVIRNNAANNGAGVHIQAGGNMIMTDGEIHNNTAAINGGGVNMAVRNPLRMDAQTRELSDFEMRGGIIRDNTANHGGGVNMLDGIFTLDGGAITNNTGRNVGGGVNVGGSTVVQDHGAVFSMISGVIQNNNAPNGAGVAVRTGGINVASTGLRHISRAEFTMRGGTILNNTATDNGGGVYVVGDQFADAILNLVYGLISNNTAQNGAGVAVADNAILNMTQGLITNNTAQKGAGVMVANGYLHMYTSAVFSAQAKQAVQTGSWENAMPGPPFSAVALSLSGNNSIISSNTAANGGGVWVGKGGTFVMPDGNITNNRASQNGGGVYVTGEKGRFVMLGASTIEDNTATRGAGVAVTDNAIFSMNSGFIQNNTSSTMGIGGGIYANLSTVIINDGTISSNSAQRGAGIHVGADSVLVMHGGLVTGNNASYRGGGVNVGMFDAFADHLNVEHYRATFHMYGGVISSNTAQIGGGVQIEGATNYGPANAISPTSSRFEMHGGEIINNTAANQGGGVRIGTRGVFEMFDGNISGNFANGPTGTASGGGVHVGGGQHRPAFPVGGGRTVTANSHFIMHNGAINGNFARQGGGVWVGGNGYAMFVMNNGKIQNNIANTRGFGGDAEGGGVRAGGNGTFTMHNGLIANNQAIANGVAVGGGIAVVGLDSPSHLNLLGGQIINNQAVAYNLNTGIEGITYGGGVHFRHFGFDAPGSSYIRIEADVVIQGNTASDIAPEIDARLVARYTTDPTSNNRASYVAANHRFDNHEVNARNGDFLISIQNVGLHEAVGIPHGQTVPSASVADRWINAVFGEVEGYEIVNVTFTHFPEWEYNGWDSWDFLMPAENVVITVYWKANGETPTEEPTEDPAIPNEDPAESTEEPTEPTEDPTVDDYEPAPYEPGYEPTEPAPYEPIVEAPMPVEPEAAAPQAPPAVETPEIEYIPGFEGMFVEDLFEAGYSPNNFAQIPNPFLSAPFRGDLTVADLVRMGYGPGHFANNPGNPFNSPAFRGMDLAQIADDINPQTGDSNGLISVIASAGGLVLSAATVVMAVKRRRV